MFSDVKVYVSYKFINNYTWIKKKFNTWNSQMVNANVTDKCTRLACPLLQNMKTESDGRKINDILKQRTNISDE